MVSCSRDLLFSCSLVLLLDCSIVRFLSLAGSHQEVREGQQALRPSEWGVHLGRTPPLPLPRSLVHIMQYSQVHLSRFRAHLSCLYAQRRKPKVDRHELRVRPTPSIPSVISLHGGDSSSFCSCIALASHCSARARVCLVIHVTAYAWLSPHHAIFSCPFACTAIDGLLSRRVDGTPFSHAFFPARSLPSRPAPLLSGPRALSLPLLQRSPRHGTRSRGGTFGGCIAE